MGTAHVLELVPKMGYDAETYAAVTSTLYRFFGIVGAPIQVAAAIAAAVLAVMVRSPAFLATLFGAICLTLSIVLWGAFVAPVNAEWSRSMETAPESVPAAYLRLRERWEYGHVIAFAGWLGGFCFLLASVIAEIPSDRPA